MNVMVTIIFVNSCEQNKSLIFIWKIDARIYIATDKKSKSILQNFIEKEIIWIISLLY